MAQLSLFAMCLIAVSLAAEDGANAIEPSQKNHYTFFHPTPDGQMREMSTDRPDSTESPISVDAGHFQFELSFFDFGRDREQGSIRESTTIIDANLKIGLTNTTDLQFVFSPYQREVFIPGGGGASEITSASDLTIRFKWNCWGNDPLPGENSALGLMPFIKIATGTRLSNEHTEGGLILMYSRDLADDCGLGFMLEADFVYDDADDDYDIDWVHTVVFGQDVGGPVGLYIEYVGTAHSDSDALYQAQASGGITVGLGDNWALDVGGRLGLNRAAEDLGLFVGTSFRY